MDDQGTLQEILGWVLTIGIPTAMVFLGKYLTPIFTKIKDYLSKGQLVLLEMKELVFTITSGANKLLDEATDIPEAAVDSVSGLYNELVDDITEILGKIETNTFTTEYAQEVTTKLKSYKGIAIEAIADVKDEYEEFRLEVEDFKVSVDAEANDVKEAIKDLLGKD